MCLFEKTVGLLRLGVILLVLVLELLTFQLGLVVIEGLITLLSIDELVVEVLKLAQVSNDTTLVFFLARLLERVSADLEYLKVVTQAVQVLHRLVE